MEYILRKIECHPSIHEMGKKCIICALSLIFLDQGGKVISAVYFLKKNCITHNKKVKKIFLNEKIYIWTYRKYVTIHKYNDPNNVE